MCRRSLFALLAAVCCFCSCQAASGPGREGSAATTASAEDVARFTEQAIESSQLLYVSDYFSFTGFDKQGRVAMALDNNRGRDGEQYQAEHIVFLHDDQKRWVDVPGFSRYENPSHELKRIPDSEYFSFEGDPAHGLTVRSKQAPIVLKIAPLEVKVIRANDQRVFAWTSAPAVLDWEERHIEGRVIYEYLVTSGENRLSRGLGTRTLLSPFSFQGLYLETDEIGDLYLHRAQGAFDPSGELAQIGFYADGSQTSEVQDLDWRILTTTQGPGLFRWPQSWRATWRSPAHAKSRLEVEVIDFKRVQTLLFGGYAMAVVTGILEQDGKKVPVYGFGELIQWL